MMNLGFVTNACNLLEQCETRQDYDDIRRVINRHLDTCRPANPDKLYPWSKDVNFSDEDKKAGVVLLRELKSKRFIPERGKISLVKRHCELKPNGGLLKSQHFVEAYFMEWA